MFQFVACPFSSNAYSVAGFAFCCFADMMAESMIPGTLIKSARFRKDRDVVVTVAMLVSTR